MYIMGILLVQVFAASIVAAMTIPAWWPVVALALAGGVLFQIAGGLADGPQKLSGLIAGIVIGVVLATAKMLQPGDPGNALLPIAVTVGLTASMAAVVSRRSRRRDFRQGVSDALLILPERETA